MVHKRTAAVRLLAPHHLRDSPSHVIYNYQFALLTVYFTASIVNMSRAAALKRLMTEYKQLVSNGSPDGMFTAGPISEDDFFTWEALIEGPKDTPFEGGVFLAKLTFVRAFLRARRKCINER